MRLLFVQDLGYFVWGGGLKLNRMVARQLAAAGHECRAVVLHEGHREIAHDLEAEESIEVVEGDGDRLSVVDAGVAVDACLNLPTYRRRIIDESAEFDPDVIVFNTGEYGYRKISLLPANVLERTVVSVLVLEALPFGPHSARPNRKAARRLRRAGGMITMNRRLQEYALRWGGVASRVLYFPAYGSPPFPDLGCFDRGSVTLINVSVMKGLPIFLQLARSLPSVPFAAVPTWGTTPESLQALNGVANIEIMEPSRSIDDIFSKTKVLLVPSLWHEAFGLVVVEAMLRGIPVLTSDVGGLPESKLGVDFVLPVRPITEWRKRYPWSRHKTLVVPEQKMGPWVKALGRLVTNRSAYEALSKASRDAALDFAARTTIEPFAEYYLEVARRSRPTVS